MELGKGAFGVVVKGRYRLSPVAIKRLIDQSPEQQRQFVKEMAILRACRGSRYIVPFVGASLQPVRPPALTAYLALCLRMTCWLRVPLQSALGASPDQRQCPGSGHDI